MVEMRGVEPLSESIAMRTSPSADCIFYFAADMPADGLTDVLSRWISLSPSENWSTGILQVSSQLLLQEGRGETLAI